MTKIFVVLATLLAGGPAFAAQDCAKFNQQLSYNAVEPIKDIISGKIVGSTRLFSNRCEKAGQTLEIVLSSDPVDGGNKRKAQARVLVTKVTNNIAFSAFTDSMAVANGFKNTAALQAAMNEIYGKSGQDLSKETWTFIEFKAVR